MCQNQHAFIIVHANVLASESLVATLSVSVACLYSIRSREGVKERKKEERKQSES